MPAPLGNKNKQTHGMKHTRFYSIWVGMKTRCLNKNHTWFKHYGGKGVKIEPKWLSFVGFMEDMHLSYVEHSEQFGEKNTTLDRVDGNSDYSKRNCKWATRLEQSNNVKSLVFIQYAGKNQTVSQWARELGMGVTKLHNRLFKYKMPLNKALTSNTDFRLKK